MKSGLAALRDFDPAEDRNGSGAPDPVAARQWRMSAWPPIATESMRRRELSRCAKRGCEQSQHTRIALIVIRVTIANRGGRELELAGRDFFQSAERCVIFEPEFIPGKDE